MRKSLAGLVLISGPIVSLIGGAISATANSAQSSPADDWYYDLISGVGVVMILAGLAMFFVGAMVFSRSK